jgi:predicted CopG family antitoxin
MAKQQSESINIKISRNHHDELAKLGTLHDSFDSVIGKLLEKKERGD